MSKRIVLLQALAATPADVGRIVRHVDESKLRLRPLPDQWSLLDVLAHFIDIEARYRARLARVVAEERPLLPSLHPDPEDEPPQIAAAVLLQQFQAARAETLAFLSACSPKDWQRQAVHETLGETTLRFLVQYLVDHDTVHLNQMVEIQRGIVSSQ